MDGRCMGDAWEMGVLQPHHRSDSLRDLVARDHLPTRCEFVALYVVFRCLIFQVIPLERNVKKLTKWLAIKLEAEILDEACEEMVPGTAWSEALRDPDAKFCMPTMPSQGASASTAEAAATRKGKSTRK